MKKPNYAILQNDPMDQKIDPFFQRVDRCQFRPIRSREDGVSALISINAGGLGSLQRDCHRP